MFANKTTVLAVVLGATLVNESSASLSAQLEELNSNILSTHVMSDEMRQQLKVNSSIDRIIVLQNFDPIPVFGESNENSKNLQLVKT